MWSNSILNEYPTYQSQYALELLHSLGSVFDTHYLTNENLRHAMIDFAQRDDQCFYQLALHAYEQLQINKSFDLISVFNEEEFNAIQNSRMNNTENLEKTKSYQVAAVHVTPKSTRLMPLERIQGHRALRHKAFHGIEDFCLVYLKPDASQKYINKCRHYENVFHSGIVICNYRYHLFGASNSQFREHSYWFIRATSLEDIQQKRQLLGDFSGIVNIGKYVARLGLWFSKSNPTGIKLDYVVNDQEFQRRIQQRELCVTMMDDIERNDYCFTDGNGLISKGLARLIAERLDYLVKSEENVGVLSLCLSNSNGGLQRSGDDGKLLEKPEFTTVVGPVIVTKNPCPYAGDIMTLEAVDLPELHCLQDVIVFSTQGDRPDFNKIAGSDLDGDQYFVYWGHELQLSSTNEPLKYQSQLPTIRSTCITPKDFIDYCLSSIGATTYGEIYNLHAIIVDQNKENHARRTCQKLAIEMANMFSAAIDSGKTGYEIDQKRIKEIRKITGSTYLDFLMKKRSYPSQSILGILYRRALEFKTRQPELFEGQDSNDPTNSFTKPNEKNFRFYVKVRTALNIAPSTIREELQVVFGTKVPSNFTIEEWSQYYQKKHASTTQPRKLSSDASSEEIEDIRSVMDQILNEIEAHTTS